VKVWYGYGCGGGGRRRHRHHHQISHFSILAGKYSPTLGYSNQQH